MIRRATLHDTAAIARIEVETWRATYAGILADRMLVAMSVSRQVRLWQHEMRRGTVWVWDDGGVCGFSHGGRQRNPALGCGGEVYTLYVRPDAQGLGIGRELLLAVFEELVAAGIASALLWVLRDNPSRFFYEHMGGRQGFHRHVPVAGEAVPALSYVWTDLAGVLRHHGHSAGR